jgi:amino acid permease
MLPYAFYKAGYLNGVLIVIVTSYLNYYSINLMMIVAKQLPKNVRNIPDFGY